MLQLCLHPSHILTANYGKMQTQLVLYKCKLHQRIYIVSKIEDTSRSVFKFGNKRQPVIIMDDCRVDLV